MNFSQAQLLLNLRRSCKRWTLCPPKARGKGASQAPFKVQLKWHFVTSSRCVEVTSKFHFLGWQDGLQDFLSDVALSCAYRKFHCVVRNNEINRVFRRARSAEFLAELKQKIKENRRGERSPVCRSKPSRYLKQKRKYKSRASYVRVDERGKKTAS